MDDVQVGSGSTLYPQVVCYNGVRLGARVTIHSGTVIGPDGFGFCTTGGRFLHQDSADWYRRDRGRRRNRREYHHRSGHDGQHRG